MDELKAFSNSVGGTWAALVSAVVGIAVFLPKVLNAVKSDMNNGNVLDRLSNLEKKADIQDKKIHKQAVKITKLVVLVIKLEGLIAGAGVQIHEALRDEISELTKDDDLGE